MTSKLLKLPPELITRIATACLHPDPRTFEALALTSRLHYEICKPFIPWHNRMKKRWGALILSPRAAARGLGLFTGSKIKVVSLAEWLLRLVLFTSQDEMSMKINGCAGRVTAGYIQSVRHLYSKEWEPPGVPDFFGINDGADEDLTKESRCEKLLEEVAVISLIRGNEVAAKLVGELMLYITSQRDLGLSGSQESMNHWTEKVAAAMLLQQLPNLRECVLPGGWGSGCSGQPSLFDAWGEMLHSIKPPSDRHHDLNQYDNQAARFPQNLVRVISPEAWSYMEDFWPLFDLPSLKEVYIQRMSLPLDHAPSSDFSANLTTLALRSCKVDINSMTALFSRTPEVKSFKYDVFDHTGPACDWDSMTKTVADHFADQLVELALTIDPFRAYSVTYGIDVKNLQALVRLERFEFDASMFALPPRAHVDSCFIESQKQKNEKEQASHAGDPMEHQVYANDHRDFSKYALERRAWLQGIQPLSEILASTVSDVKIQAHDSTESAMVVRQLLRGWNDSGSTRKLSVRYAPSFMGTPEWEGLDDDGPYRTLQFMGFGEHNRPSVRSVVEGTGGTLCHAWTFNNDPGAKQVEKRPEALGWYNEFEDMALFPLPK